MQQARRIGSGDALDGGHPPVPAEPESTPARLWIRTSAAPEGYSGRETEATMDDDEQDVEADGPRVASQSEEVTIEAAEFLVATRTRREHRLQIAKELEDLRLLDREP